MFMSLILVSFFYGKHHIKNSLNELNKCLDQILMNNGGLPPRPWDIPVYPKSNFVNETAKLEIPNTAHVEV
jgi:hypothetical protein